MTKLSKDVAIAEADMINHQNQLLRALARHYRDYSQRASLYASRETNKRKAAKLRKESQDWLDLAERTIGYQIDIQPITHYNELARAYQLRILEKEK